MNFSSFREHVLGWTRTVAARFQNPHDDWAATLILHVDPPENVVHVTIPVEYIEPKGRAILYTEFIPFMIKETKASGFALILSSWRAKLTDDEVERRKLGEKILASKHPKREEVLWVVLADQKNREALMADIRRRLTAPPTLRPFSSVPIDWEMPKRFDARKFGELRALGLRLVPILARKAADAI